MMVANDTSSVAVRVATLDDMETLGRFGAHLMSHSSRMDRDHFPQVNDMTHVAYAGHLRQALGRPTSSRRACILEMGDDMAGALGHAVTSTCFWLMVVAVMLVAAATAAPGQVVFIALAAPQIAQSLCQSRSMSLSASASAGALLLLAADAIGQDLFSPLSIPVGIVTVGLDGLFMPWLLVRNA
jgi:hypothetical protein